MTVYPELITSRDDDAPTGPWVVERGLAERGGAWCNVSERRLSVPLESSPTARLVQAHELMHARVSPMPAVIELAQSEASLDALTSAEEFRVNTLLKRRGFDTTHLQDGTEAFSIGRLAATKAWPEVLMSLTTVLDTGSEDDVVRAINKARPEWKRALTIVRKRLHALADDLAIDVIASTTLVSPDIQLGFQRFSVEIAKVIDRAKDAKVPTEPEGLRTLRRSLETGARRPPSGRFAPLVWAQTDCVPRPEAKIAKGVRPTSSGTVMRYPGRLLTDPQRRAFVRPHRNDGGIVVIDQSGSMDIDVTELEAIVRQCPAALIIGYSHRPGDMGVTPNAWILASEGKIASSLPAGSIGNGVDGPILEHVVKVRQPRERIVWVCDGQVTDSNDHPVDELTKEVADLIVREKIIMARHLSDVAPALRKPDSRSMSVTDLESFGRVGRAIISMRANRDCRAAWAPVRGLDTLNSQNVASLWQLDRQLESEGQSGEIAW